MRSERHYLNFRLDGRFRTNTVSRYASTSTVMPPSTIRAWEPFAFAEKSPRICISRLSIAHTQLDLKSEGLLGVSWLTP